MDSPKKFRAKNSGWQRAALLVILAVAICGGLSIGYICNNMFPKAHSLRAEKDAFSRSSTSLSTSGRTVSSHGSKAITLGAEHKWAGNTVHSVMTSSGDHYQNFQGRIMYATYQLVQRMPGGERLTGFTRILHRTVPDILMDEIPTFHAQPVKPQCDGWCDYPVANRPHAIKAFFDAAALNESMIQGAWVLMLECDYVWMQPMQVPGSAWDPSVAGVQFLYDYINPTSARSAYSMKALYPDGPASDIPASGPAPVLLRLAEWRAVVDDYVRLSVQMEKDERMKKDLEWVREMYAWDAALPYHKDIKITTELHTDSSTIVQPPFDDGLGRAALCHYTWGALYHEGLPSKGAKQVYRWEKRDYNDLKFELKVPHIPMPPAYQDGWILEFDAPLTRPRHDLVVLMLAQMNRAIDTLPDLTEKWKEFEPKLAAMKAEWAEKHKAPVATSRR